jgi:ferric-dicitrate binding protein FerR (iron transport regulator)
LEEKKKIIFERAVANWEVPQACTKEASWDKLQARLEMSSTVKVVPLYRKASVWVAAACIAAVLFFAASLIDEKPVEFVASTYEQVILPDRSVVHLTPGSSIAYASSWDQREVILKGEAFFEVAKGETFTVHTAAGDVSVLGTSFNVYAQNESFAVECITGKVNVAAGDVAHVITAGQGVKTRSGALSVPYEHGLTSPSWQPGTEVNYTNADISRVIDHVVQRYGVTVRLEDNLGESGKEFSGTFTDSGAFETLTLLALVLDLELEQIDENSFALHMLK